MARQRDWEQSDYALAVALAGGEPYRRAAEQVGVSRATVDRRMADPEFRRLVTELRRSLVHEATGQLAAALTDAVAQLRLIAADGDSEGNRLKASVALLDQARQYQVAADLEERVRQLEERAAGGGADEGTGGAVQPGVAAGGGAG